MMQRLNDFLLAAFQEGKNTILLIDEAQDLETEVLESLRLLSNLETAKEKILQIVLSGQPELATRLAQPNLRQLKQRIAVRCRIEPLGRHELADYIAARLSVAGGRGDLFAAATLDPIWEFARGIPRLINTVCDNALLVGYALGRQTIDAEVIGEVVSDLGRIDAPLELPTLPPLARADPHGSSRSADGSTGSPRRPRRAGATAPAAAASPRGRADRGVADAPRPTVRGAAGSILPAQAAARPTRRAGQAASPRLAWRSRRCSWSLCSLRARGRRCAGTSSARGCSTCSAPRRSHATSCRREPPGPLSARRSHRLGTGTCRGRRLAAVPSPLCKPERARSTRRAPRAGAAPDASGVAAARGARRRAPQRPLDVEPRGGSARRLPCRQRRSRTQPSELPAPARDAFSRSSSSAVEPSRAPRRSWCSAATR